MCFHNGAQGSDPKWLSALTRSAERHGYTWLHHLHIGLEVAERADFAAAAAHFEASIQLRANAHALRGLAVMAPVPSAVLSDKRGDWRAVLPRTKLHSGVSTDGGRNAVYNGSDSAHHPGTKSKVELYDEAWAAAVVSAPLCLDRRLTWVTPCPIRCPYEFNTLS